MALSGYLGLGALFLFVCSFCNKNKNHSKKITNVVEQPPIIRDPVGGNSIFSGYFGRVQDSHNKNSIL